jgi:hypothetical protein
LALRSPATKPTYIRDAIRTLLDAAQQSEQHGHVV